MHGCSLSYWCDCFLLFRGCRVPNDTMAAGDMSAACCAGVTIICCVCVLPVMRLLLLWCPAALDDKELVNALWLRGCTDITYK